MPYSRKSDDVYDDEAWKGLRFMCEVWNRGPHPNKVRPALYHSYIKEAIKRYHENIETPEALALTIFTEFFFLNRDDGIHRYGYYVLGDINYLNDRTITVTQPDGSRRPYFWIPLYSWTSTVPEGIGSFPFGLYMNSDDYLTSRCLLRLMLEKGSITKDILTDYEFNKDDYERVPYEAIDFRIGQFEDGKFIEEKPLDHIPDPFHVIENGEVMKLYESILRACVWLMELFKTHPEMFDFQNKPF